MYEENEDKFNQEIEINDEHDFGNIIVKKRRMYIENNKLYNGIKLRIDSCFGNYQKVLNSNVMFISDEEFFYINGKHIIIYNILRKKQKFIIKCQNDTDVTAMNYSQTNSNSNLICIALEGDKNNSPKIKIFNLYNDENNELMTLTNKDHDNTITYIDILFIKNGKYLVTLNNKFEINFWKLKNKKLLIECLYKDEINLLKLIPNLENGFSISGPNFFENLNYNSLEKKIIKSGNADIMKIIKENTEEKITYHLFINYKDLLLITTETKIFIFNNFVLLKIIENQFNGKEKPIINCITSMKFGFIIGYKNLGIITIYNTINYYNFEKLADLKIPKENIESIININCSIDLNNIVISSYKTSSDLNINLNKNIEIFTLNVAVAEAIKYTFNQPFDFLLPDGFHYGKIIGLCTSVSKNLLISIGEDNSLKVWDYFSQPKQVLSQNFLKEILCVDIHPLSLILSIGYKNGFKSFFLLENELKLSFSLSTGKPCHTIKYSEKGNYLAVSLGGTLNIYDSFNYEKKITINYNNYFKEIKWKKKDLLLLSLLNNGNINIYNIISEENKNYEFYNKNFKFLSCDYDPELDLLVVCCDDNKFRIYNNKNRVGEISLENFSFETVKINKKLKAIFFGSNDGRVRVYLWPIVNDKLQYYDLPINQKSINHLIFSPKNEYLITNSDDSSIFFINMIEVVEGEEILVGDIFNLKSKNSSNNYFNLIDLCLISNEYQKNMIDNKKNLNLKISNLKSGIEEEKEKIALDNQKKLNSIENYNKRELDKEKDEMTLKIDDAEKKNKNITENILKSNEVFKKEYENLEEENKNNLLYLYEENEKLKSELELFLKDYDNNLIDINKEYQNNLEIIRKNYDEKYELINEKFKKTILNLKKDQEKFKEALFQTEDDYNNDIEATKKKFVDQLNNKHKEAEKLRSLNSKLKKDNEKNLKRKENLESLIEEMKKQNEQLKLEFKTFEEKEKQMKKQLKDQEKIINEKENKVKSIRNENHHLQNYKNVYDYQFISLKEEQEPLNNHLEILENHIKTLYKELLSEAENYKSLENNIKDLNNKIKKNNESNENKSKKLNYVKRYFENLIFNLNNLLENKNSNFIENLEKKLEDTLNFSKNIDFYLNKNKNKKLLINDKNQSNLDKNKLNELNNIKEELLKQRDYISKKIISTHNINKRKDIERENVFNNNQLEGQNLINKCNALRKERLILNCRIVIAKHQADKITEELKNVSNKKNIKTPLVSSKKKDLKKKELPFELYKKEKNKVKTFLSKKFNK